MKTLVCECDICHAKSEELEVGVVSIFGIGDTDNEIQDDTCIECQRKIITYIKNMKEEYKNEKSD